MLWFRHVIETKMPIAAFSAIFSNAIQWKSRRHLNSHIQSVIPIFVNICIFIIKIYKTKIKYCLCPLYQIWIKTYKR